MTKETELQQVAKLAGLAESYISAWGDEAHVSEEQQRKILAGLGYDTSSDSKLLASAQKMHQQPVLDPVLVIQQDKPLEISLHVATSARVNEFSWQLETEQGDVTNGQLSDLDVRDERTENGAIVFLLPVTLSEGYHTLNVNRKRRKTPYEMTLIVTPASCYKQPTLAEGKKSWGTSIQLYTLRTEQNWGIGDFGDLKQLVGEIAQRGGDFVGLNPIHSLFPAMPESASPYSPSSRTWLNTIYLDVGAIAEFAQSEEAQNLVGSVDFQQRISVARSNEWVQYREVSALKMAILPLLFKVFQQQHLAKNSVRAKAFQAFVKEGGDSLVHQAAFDALHAELIQQDSNCWGWPVFPEKYRQFDRKDVQNYIIENQDTIQLYMYSQWQAAEQLSEVQHFAKEQGMTLGLYRDLAVGVSECGSETWANDGTLCMDLSVGAPPDILGPLGQNWGLPPLNPLTLKNSGYKAYINMLRANMRSCGALRIDHVLGLLRLWLIPRGESANNGAYIYYPVQDMLSILALESHRHQCAVIGEDLGTVPDEIISLLADAGVHSYKVFFFEVAEDGGYYSPSHYPEQSMSALCTHDMPTLKGFWHCEDLKMGSELGLYPDKEQLQGLFDDRAESKQRLVDSLNWHGYLPDGIGHNANAMPMEQALNFSMQKHLAAGASALLSLQLEDWLEMDKPVNIPGTVDEYPNWRRKLSANLGDIFSRDDIAQLTNDLTRIRAEASQK
ncbi:4-alpha-glucanotransferase [Vibrio sp. SS-MA-C1-2]|uniref:4-alpha-glucanotransferase n=1 Tax=Vibrio sp. SS-MA-C1-2 TaxID=2908646 RepID=UPI001F48A1CD|nr:4-alpha-glucanotransferase [Vibrio sp. SS-MA-C1-2]UJF17498.1 4-alpha-glucanotransferase [Vibrio sp. SS-MA-C1-2]